MTTRRGRGQAKSDKLEELHWQLIDAVGELTSSEAWMRMLAVAARFHDYSPSNVLLISAQRPDATRVAGIRTWNSLGRRVIKGEHGIAILAPCVYRAPPGENPHERDRGAVDVAPRGQDTAVPRSAPAAVDDEPVRHLRGFKVVHVFDVTQTDGEPLPDVTPENLTGVEPDGLWDHLADLVHADGYGLERGPVRVGNGYTDYRARTVRISDGLEPAQAVKTLAHELGHIRADHEHRFTEYGTSMTCRGQAEVEAESIAFLVATQAGLDATAYSVPYVAGWSGGDIDVLRHSMTTVISTARAIAPAGVFNDTSPLKPVFAGRTAVVTTPADVTGQSRTI